MQDKLENTEEKEKAITHGSTTQREPLLAFCYIFRTFQSVNCFPPSYSLVILLTGLPTFRLAPSLSLSLLNMVQNSLSPTSQIHLFFP
jgi:hypothetical protein